MAVGDAYRESIRKKEEALASGTDLEHAETVDSTLSRKQKTQKHLRRFWVCYFIAGIIFSAIFLPIFFTLIIPAIAQRIVDDTDLPVYNAEITDPDPSHVTFSIDTALNMPKGIKARTDPFTLRLFNRGTKPFTPYIGVKMREFNLNGPTQLTVINHHTEVLEEDEFVAVLSEAVYSKEFIMSARGATTGHLGALKAGLSLDKDVRMKGLDKLSGFSIESARLVYPAEDDGTNLRGRANLPNHSVVGFALGNVTLNLKSDDILLGYADIDNVFLKPGNNTVDLRGRIDIPTVLDNIVEIMAQQGDVLRKGNLRLSASGNKTVYHGKHIPFFERVLNNLTLQAELPIMTVLLDTLKGLGGGKGLADILNNLGDMGNELSDLTDALQDLHL